MTTKYIPAQGSLTGVFHVVDNVYLQVGHNFETSEAIEAALTEAEITFTDPPGTGPTGRVRVFKNDNSHILLLLGGTVPNHIEANCFFTPSGDQMAAIQEGFGYELELVIPVGACAINQEVFPSNNFNNDNGLIDSAGMDPFNGSWSTDGDGWSTWTPNATLIEGLYQLNIIRDSARLGNTVYVGIGGTGTFIAEGSSATSSGVIAVRNPTLQSIRVYEGDGEPAAADSLFIFRVG
jgi:hypothetical protein